ncbi:MAG: cytochrome c [Candidatus Synoicihabitans palmerolidicus]|nr:cytochrome c [Candidatus Synoicihabitans palmerolidicus]
MSDDNYKKSDPKIEQAAASDEQIQEVHSVLLREKSEPSEGYSPIPLLLLGFVSTMIFVVSIYFIHNRGGFTSGIGEAAMIYDERFDPKLHRPDTGVVKVVDPMVVGKRTYAQVCAACHQINGAGVPNGFPPLVDSHWVTGSEERVVRILLHGLSGPVEVNGNVYNGIMPAFGAGSAYNWDDAKIVYVLTYIRNEWGNEATAITPEQVTAIREADGARSTAMSADELLALP